MGLAIVAEPNPRIRHRIPEENSNWVGDNSGSAVIVRAAVDLSPPLQTIGRGEGYIAAK